MLFYIIKSGNLILSKVFKEESEETFDGGYEIFMEENCNLSLLSENTNPYLFNDKVEAEIMSKNYINSEIETVVFNGF